MKPRIKYPLKIGITLGILFLIFVKIDIKKLTDHFIEVQIAPFVIALLLHYIVRYFSALQNYIICERQGLNLPVRRIFAINLVSNFYALFLPGDIAGGGIRWYKYSKESKRRAGALAAILWGRIVDYTVIVIIGLVAFLIKNPFQDQRIIEISIAFLVTLLFFQVIVIVKKCWNSIEHLTKITVNKVIRVNKVRNAMYSVLHSFASFQELNQGDMVKIYLITIISNMIGIFVFLFLAISANIDLSVYDIAWIRTVSILIMVIPVTISGLGLREGIIIFLLGLYEIPQEHALIYSLTIFFRLVVVAISGGIIEFMESYIYSEKSKKK